MQTSDREKSKSGVLLTQQPIRQNIHKIQMLNQNVRPLHNPMRTIQRLVEQKAKGYKSQLGHIRALNPSGLSSVNMKMLAPESSLSHH